ncbi:PQQ-binding-like beta-propeller repeat protein [Nocardiopsis sp. CA-288880]|uniref:outer membrane protein assembly factor BamB family protein n=1 Tax=Nocardiopsis sp. CA-288880 TaxID=3239995 RepID=UPI003D968106
MVELEHRSAVSEVAWDWSASDGSRLAVFPVPGGVAVLQAAGIVVLSGETGEELWRYRVSEGEVSGNVSDDGRHVVLRSEGDAGADTGGTELTVLDSGTGEIVHEFDSSGVEAVERVGWMPQIAESLSAVMGDIWFVHEEENVVAYHLGDDRDVWSTPTSDLSQCAGVGSVDDLAVLNEALVVAVTCYEQPEDREPVDMVEGREFVSGLVGLDPASGEELWRHEEQLGLFPADSQGRTLAVQESGLLVAEYPYTELRQFVDPAEGEVRGLGRNNVLWSSGDGSRLGVWHAESRDYRIEDRSGGVLASLEEETGASPDPTVDGGGFLGLEEGVLHITEEILADAEEPVIGYFSGFEGNSEIDVSGHGGARWEVHAAVSVPGAVVVSHTETEGRSGVIGLR